MTDRGTQGRQPVERAPLLALMAIALALRLLVLLVRAPHDWFAGGDGVFYVDQAWRFAHGTLAYPFRTVGPLYPVFLSWCWRMVPTAIEPIDPFAVPVAFLTFVRVVQVLAGTATVAACHALARAAGASPRAALVTAAGVAVTPAFVIEPFLLHTEAFALALVATSVWLWIRARRRARVRDAVAAGAVAALAGMTRLVLLPLPALIAAHALLWHDIPRRARVAAAIATLATTVVLYAPWLVWLHAGTGLWVPEGFSFNLLAGATGSGGPPDRATFDVLTTRSEARESRYLGEAARTIAASGPVWVVKRARAFAAALVQPHGTSDLGGPSFKAAVSAFMANEGSFASLASFAIRPATWVRVTAWVIQVAMLLLVLVGAARTWRQPAWSPVYIAVGWIFLIHAMLLVSPRYLFLAQPLLWAIAGVGGMRLAGRDR